MAHYRPPCGKFHLENSPFGRQMVSDCDRPATWRLSHPGEVTQYACDEHEPMVATSATVRERLPQVSA